MLTIEEFEGRVRLAIDDARADGWAIDCGVTINGNSCCPIGAMAIAAGLRTPTSDWQDLAEQLALGRYEAESFVQAFDGLPHRRVHPTVRPFAALGSKLRQEYIL